MGDFSEANSLNKNDVVKWVYNTFGITGGLAIWLALNWTGSHTDYVYAVFLGVGVLQDLIRRYIRGETKAEDTKAK